MADDGTHRSSHGSRRHSAPPNHLRHRAGEVEESRRILPGETLCSERDYEWNNLYGVLGL